jgi:hypothetical protein
MCGFIVLNASIGLRGCAQTEAQSILGMATLGLAWRQLEAIHFDKAQLS